MDIPAKEWKEISAVSGLFQNESAGHFVIKESVLEPTNNEGFLLKPYDSVNFESDGSKKMWAYNSALKAGDYYFDAE